MNLPIVEGDCVCGEREGERERNFIWENLGMIHESGEG